MLRRLFTALSVLSLLLCAAADDGKPQRTVSAPGAHEAEADPAIDFRDVQDRACRAAERVRRSVVAVEKASGVILTPEGLILSQGHVSHGATRKPGDRVKVILHDGHECRAELLGVNATHDISLLKLLEPGPYPFAPLDGDAKVKPGDWVLEFGHPFIYQVGRPALTRLGRVLSRTEDGFCTDCLMAPGDSGAPFFNLDGKLVGVIRDGSPELLKLAGDAPAIKRNLGLIMSVTAGRVVARHLQEMKRGETPPYVREECERVTLELAKAPGRLQVRDWLLGPRTLAAFPLDGRDAPGVVQVLNSGAQVALGTAVGAGEVLTKASELPPEPQCRLPGGNVVAVTVVGVDMAYDLALLRVDASGEKLRAARWPAHPTLPRAATFLAAVSAGGSTIAVGIASAPPREVSNAARPAYTLPLRQEATAPGLEGKASPDGRYHVTDVWDTARAAGVRPGDVLVSLDGRAVSKAEDLRQCIRGRLSGDVLSAKLVRGEKEIEVKVPLCARARVPNRNYRYGDFPVVFEHAVPLFPHECGGPLVDLDGQFVGINVARAGPHGGAAVPAGRIQQVLADLRAGKGADQWSPQANGPTGR
jgi:serine protease Do